MDVIHDLLIAHCSLCSGIVHQKALSLRNYSFTTTMDIFSSTRTAPSSAASLRCPRQRPSFAPSTKLASSSRTLIVQPRRLCLAKSPGSSSIRLSSIDKDVKVRGCHQVNLAGIRLCYDSVAHKAIDCTELLSGMSPESSADEQNHIYDAFEQVCDYVSMLLLLFSCVCRVTKCKTAQLAQIHRRFHCNSGWQAQ